MCLWWIVGFVVVPVESVPCQLQFGKLAHRAQRFHVHMFPRWILQSLRLESERKKVGRSFSRGLRRILPLLLDRTSRACAQLRDAALAPQPVDPEAQARAPRMSRIRSHRPEPV
jgi:hypothetical protein